MLFTLAQTKSLSQGLQFGRIFGRIAKTSALGHWAFHNVDNNNNNSAHGKELLLFGTSANLSYHILERFDLGN